MLATVALDVQTYNTCHGKAVMQPWRVKIEM